MLTYLLFMAPALLLALWAQMRVKSTFNRYAKVPSRSGMTGADVARMILRARGLTDVRVEPTRGFLTDHYDPREKVLRLSEATHGSNSVAAIGVAAHEAGHALQHADNYSPLHFRSAVVPVVSLGSRLLPFLIISALLTGAFVHGGLLAWLSVAALGLIALFSVITLPVEFNASSRALAVLDSGGILVGQELDGARNVLNAAALTYVAAAVSAILQMGYYLLMLIGVGGDD